MPLYESITLNDGRRGFRKSASGSEGGRQLQAEADGLAALAATGQVRTPAVFALDNTALVTEWVDTGEGSERGWRVLGEQLAAMQAIEQAGFGFTADNYCGNTPQPNQPSDDGHAFFAEHRLLYQCGLAFDAGLLERPLLNAIERLCSRLEELVPSQAPALLHGDLWRGNVLFDNRGEPVLIDPACYWGWPEAEVAMSDLFGGFPDAFFDSWAAAARPEGGWRGRLPLYQLYHLLNHLNLFGGSYLPQVRSVVRTFS